jgi:hypothetical protein
MRDRLNMMNIFPVIFPGLVGPVNNTPVVGAIIDHLGYDSLTYIVQTGVLTTGGATYKLTMEEGNAANLSDTALVGVNDIIGDLTPSFIGTQGNSVFKIAYVGAKRYTRLTITPTGNGAATNFSAVAVMENPAYMATANPPA